MAGEDNVAVAPNGAAAAAPPMAGPAAAAAAPTVNLVTRTNTTMMSALCFYGRAEETPRDAIHPLSPPDFLTAIDNHKLTYGLNEEDTMTVFRTALKGDAAIWFSKDRSEEHTSELQSP